VRISNAHNVFHHDADPKKLIKLRGAVIHDISFLRGNYPNFDKIVGTELSPADSARMRKRYSGLLNYGVFSLSPKRKVANELIWKWTEATGKYVGCQFWSLKAKELFDREVEKRGGWKVAGDLETELGKKRDLSGKTRPDNSRLTHEHVYPIDDMKRWLRRVNPHRKGIKDHFKRQCISCVVLESEHKLLPTKGDDTNPWLRYMSLGIYLAPNPAWSATQRALIVEAGLLKSV
jgi:hypothetical protein